MSTAAVAARNIGGRTGGRVFPRGLSGGVGSDIDTVPRGLFGSNAAAGCCRAVGATIRAGNGRCQLGVLWRSVPRGYTLLDTVGRGPKRLSTERLELTHLSGCKSTVQKNEPQMAADLLGRGKLLWNLTHIPWVHNTSRVLQSWYLPVANSARKLRTRPPGRPCPQDERGGATGGGGSMLSGVLSLLTVNLNLCISTPTPMSLALYPTP